MKVSELSNKRAKQSDPRLGWIMFHCICKIYRDVSQATQHYHNNLLINNGTNELIETKFLGTQQILDNEMDNTQGVADNDH